MKNASQGDTLLTVSKSIRFLVGALLVFLLFQSPAFALPLPVTVPLPLAAYTYDGEGKRVSSREGGVTTTYLYDGLLPALERLPAPVALTVDYTPAG